MKTIDFFNNKGGVGKTSLVYHLAWMQAGLGARVLAADLDPQANLTSVCLTEDRLEQPDLIEHLVNSLVEIPVREQLDVLNLLAIGQERSHVLDVAQRHRLCAPLNLIAISFQRR